MRNLVAALLIFFTAMVALPAIAQDTNQADNGVTAPAEPGNAAANESAGESAPPGARQTSGDGSSVVGESGEALVKLFVLAVLLESALALVFNWRPFRDVFNSRGAKPLFSFLAALGIVFTLEPATVATLMAEYGGTLTARDRDIAYILEAMILAGGSSGVNKLLLSLGVRSRTPAEEERRPPDNEAWISVGLQRKSAVGTVDVEMVEGEKVRLLGTMGKGRRPGRILSWFFLDFGRVPTSGGYSVKPGTSYKFRLRGRDQSGKDIDSPVWGPHVIANRAVIDIELVL